MVESSPTAAAPLSPKRQQELDDAEQRARTFLGAAKVAAFNGWSAAFFAVLSILFGLFSLTSFLVGVGLAIVARNELVGRRRVRELDSSGLVLLWRNQLGFMVLIIAYCVWSLSRAVGAPDSEMTALLERFDLSPLTELLGQSVGEFVRMLSLFVYGTVIFATAISQGLNARYYFVRVARMRDYLRDEPQWVVARQRSNANR